MSFAGKIVTLGVIAKALVMGIMVSLLAVTSFEKSIVLVVVSATATGIFGILIVLIQIHSERAIHRRIDSLEIKTEEAKEEVKAQVIESTSNGETG